MSSPTVPPSARTARTLYHTDTLQKRIYAFDLAQDGSLANKRVFVTIEEGRGLSRRCRWWTAEGCLWTGLFGGWAVRRYAPDGRLLQSVAFPVANVTKLAFGGRDLTTVYATTARKGLDANALAASPRRAGCFCFRADNGRTAAILRCNHAGLRRGSFATMHSQLWCATGSGPKTYLDGHNHQGYLLDKCDR